MSSGQGAQVAGGQVQHQPGVVIEPGQDLGAAAGERVAGA